MTRQAPNGSGIIVIGSGFANLVFGTQITSMNDTTALFYPRTLDPCGGAQAMIVVIQCAASKQVDAGHLRTRDGRNILFVAQPDLAPPSETIHYAHPDEPSDTSGSWRDELRRYNFNPRNNPFGLLPAASLYTHPTYARLAERIGVDRLFILSAGWGLLSASSLTPNYNITFSTQVESYKRRRRTDRYLDFASLPNDVEAPMIFFGSKDYAPLFARLTRTHRGPRTVYFNSQQPPDAPGCQLERFVTTTRTNWHYECADAWLRKP